METILLLDSGELLISKENKAVRINWSDEVTFEEYREILMQATDAAYNGHINVLIDRTELNELPAQCRVWMKDEYLKEHGSEVIPTLRKVAIVQSKSMLGQLYFSTISAAIPLKYPNLNFKSFNDEKTAQAWIDQEGNNESTITPQTDSGKNKVFEAILKLFK